jgi:hypothetical protein
MRQDLRLDAAPTPALESAVLRILRSNVTPEEKADQIRALLLPDEAGDQDDGNNAGSATPAVTGAGFFPSAQASHAKARALALSAKKIFAGWPTSHGVGMSQSFLDDLSLLRPERCAVGQKLYLSDGRTVEIGSHGSYSLSAAPTRKPVPYVGADEMLAKMRGDIGLPARG